MPYKHIGDFNSNLGEGEVAFLERVRPILRAFSDKTGFEACAAIAKDKSGTHFGVILGSTESHLGCAIYPAKVPDGMTYTGVSIHSHGGTRSFNMSKADKILMGFNPENINLIPVHGQDLYHFSPTDYKSGPGYLATPTGLIFQNGTVESESVIQ